MEKAKTAGSLRLLMSVLVIYLVAGCVMQTLNTGADAPGTDGPADQGTRPPMALGNAASGKNVFRFETFGNEGFWTDALRLPQGIAAARVTPMQALDLGLNVDVLKVPLDIALKVVFDLVRDKSGRSSHVLNDPDTTIRLINANAVIGVAAKDSNGDGRIDILHGDKVGATCALCHTVVSKPLLRVPGGGGIGFRHDGPANHNLHFGEIAAAAQNSRALFPGLQLSLKANGGKSLGRAPRGLTENSTEAEVDAYLSNHDYYPVGMFDDSLDGNGDPMHNTPFFRQDLAGPYGSEGAIAKLDNFSNLVYTALFDPTMITTPGGRAFMRKLGGAAGDEIVESYVKVLADTGVTGYPYVNVSPHPQPGSEEAPLGVRVDNQKLIDMNAYVAALPAPKGGKVNAQMAMRGRDTFRTVGCTGCHNADQSKPVPAIIVAMKTIFPGDNPVVLAQREPPLNPVMDTPGNTFDDKMAVVNASMRGEKRGIAMPLLLDLSHKPVFLHDNSVRGLQELLNPNRGANAPHPFYIPDAATREDVAEFLRGLDDRPPGR